MAKFDPYHKWLGIPPKDQPPNHYRLLGIDLFEEDPDVIEAAADRCMAYVQQCALGEHLEASQQILNELAAAKVCLLVTEQKEQYDTELRAELEPSETGSVSPDEWDKEQYLDLLPDQSQNRRKRRTETSRKKLSPRRSRRKKQNSKRESSVEKAFRSPRVLWSIAGGGSLFFLFLILFFLFRGGSEDVQESQDQIAAVTQPLIEAEPESAESQSSPQKTESFSRIREKPTDSMAPSTSEQLVNFTIYAATNTNEQGGRLNGVTVELFQRSEKNVGEQISLGTVTTDANGQGSISVKLARNQQAGTFLAKLTKGSQIWERNLPSFPRELSQQLTVPVFSGPEYLNPVWIDQRLAQVGIDQLIEEYQSENDPDIQTVRSALELSQHILRDHPEAVREQLQARLVDQKAPSFAAFQKLPNNKIQIRSEWPTFNQPGGTLVRSLSGHTGSVQCLAVTPDGTRAVSGSSDHTLIVWDLATKQQIRTLEGHSDIVRCAAITPDGQQAVSGSYDNTLKVWNLTDGKLIRTLEGHSNKISCVALTPDGKRVISGDLDGTLKVWDLPSGRLMRTSTGKTPGMIRCVSVTPDGKQAVTDMGGRLNIWNIATGKLTRTVGGHSGSILCVALSADGKNIISGSADRTVTVSDLATGELIWKSNKQPEYITSVASTPDGQQVISGSLDGTLNVWNQADGKLSRTLSSQLGYIYCVTVTPDGQQVIAGSYDGTLKIFDLETESLVKLHEGHSMYVSAVALSDDGRHALSLARDKTLKVWDLASSELIRTLKGPAPKYFSDLVSCLAVTPDGKSAITSSSLTSDNTLKVWSLASGVIIQTFEGHSTSVSCVTVSPDGQQAISGSRDNTLKVWDLATGRLVRTFTGHSDKVGCVAETSDGRQVISGSDDKTLKVWSLVDGKLIHTLEGHADSVTCVAVTTDGQQAISGSRDNTLKVWDLAAGKLVRTLNGHTSNISCLTLTPDGRQIISASYDRTLKIWDLASGKIMATYELDDVANDFAVSPDGKTLFIGCSTGRVYYLTIQAPGETLPTQPLVNEYVAQFAVQAENINQPTRNPRQNIMIELFQQPDKSKPQRVSLGKIKTDASGQARINVKLPPQQETGDFLAILSRGNESWEKELTQFPEKLSYDFIIPAANTQKYLTPDWIEQRLAQIGIDDLLEEYAGKTAPDIQTIRAALDLSQHILRDDPQALREQLQARLVSRTEPALAAFQTLPDDQIQLRSEWPTFNQPGGTLVRTLVGTSSNTQCIVITPDGTQAISGSSDGTLKVWGLANRKLIHTLEGHLMSVQCIDVTPDGSKAISGSYDKTLKVWDLKNGKLIWTLTGHSSNVRCVAVTPDGKQAISGSWDNTLKIWDLSSGQLIRTLTGHSNNVTGVTLTPDGKQIISSSYDRTLKIWDLNSGKLIGTLNGHSGVVTCVVLNNNGNQAISGSWDNTLKIWNLSSGQLIRTLTGHSNHLDCIAVMPDGRRVVSGAWDKTLKVWDLPRGSLVQTLIGHSGSVRCVAVTPDGKQAVSASADGTTKFWDLTSSESMPKQKMHSDSVNWVSMKPDGEHIISGSYDGTLKIWGFKDGKLIQTFRPGRELPAASHVNCGFGNQAISIASNRIYLWNLTSGKLIHRLRQSRTVSCVSLTPDFKQIVSGSYDKTLKVWDLASGSLVQTLEGHSNSIHCVAVTTDGKQAISGSGDKTLKVWDLRSGKLMQTLEGHASSVNCVIVKQNGKQAISGSGDGILKLWDLASGKPVRTFAGHTSGIKCLTLRPDENLVLSGSYDKTIKMWDLKSGKLMKTYELDDIPNGLAFSPDGLTILVAGGTGRIHKLHSLGQEKINTKAAPSTPLTSTASPQKKKTKATPVKKVIFWNESPLPRSWPALSKTQQERIESVHGLVDERFIWCLDLPLDTFLKMQTELQIAHYLPQRVRPYMHKGSVYVAVVCVRDQHTWRLMANVSAQDILNENRKLQSGNWMPLEAAGYFDQEEKYLAVWIKDGPSKAYIDVGLTKAEHKSNFDKLSDLKWHLTQHDLFYDDKKQLRFTNVWYPVPASKPTWGSWYGSLQDHKDKQGVYSLQTDVSIASTKSFSTFGGAWIEHPQFVSLELNELSPQEHHKEATRLMNLGFRPQAIDADSGGDEIVSASVWYRPK